MQLRIKAGECVSDSLKEHGFTFVCGGNGSCGKCAVTILEGDVPVSEGDRSFFSETELLEGRRLGCCIGKLNRDILVEFENTENDIYIPDESGCTVERKANDKDESVISYGIAIDIGTTTLAVALVKPESGEIFDILTGINHQRSYGADVVSRIVASNNGLGPKMRDTVIEDLDGMIAVLLDRNGLNPENFIGIYIVGNTTMQHIFAGYDCSGLGVAPFTPVSIELTETNSGTLLPGISSYVGADILAGIYYCNFDKDISLLLDLGTNGEMALGNSERILVASTAAGPAFEGGNISCGIASVAGAVYDVRLSDDDNEQPITLYTIGDNSPTGICGTGIVALTSELLRNGLLDRTGLLDARLGNKIKLTADGTVTFTQKDIRELQLAKGAVRAGIDTLVTEYGIELGDIKTVYIAGGFGAELNIEKAVDIGLIPEQLMDKCVSVGNAALKGAAKFIGSNDGAATMNKIKVNCKEIVLADSAHFSEKFTEALNF